MSHTLIKVERGIRYRQALQGLFHRLRHTFAGRLVEGSTDLYPVSKLMGDSAIRMTER